jgi:glycosyltransferase involved in cell wall biosynthesis
VESVKIAVVHNLPSGGARRCLVEHCRGLRQRGHRVEAFFPDTADEAFLPLEPVVDRVHVWRAPRPPSREASLFGQVGLGTAWAAARLVRALGRIHREMAAAIDEGDFDVVLATHDQFTHAPGVLRHLRTPSAYFCQEPLRFVYEAPVGLAMRPSGGLVSRAIRAAATAAARGVLRPVDARNTRAATMILANSVYSHESIMRAYGRAARVVYLGVDTVRFRGLQLDRGNLVLTVGALHPAKGLDFVVASLARIPAARRPSLVVVSDRGYGAFRERLEAQAARCGVSLEIHMRVGEAELVEWYNRARLLAYAPYLEPFGLVALEAMACGTPVVAVAEGGTRESIRADETGLLTMRDEAAFAGAVDRVASDAALASRLSVAAAAEVRRRWTWESSTQQLEAALISCREAAGAV